MPDNTIQTQTDGPLCVKGPIILMDGTGKRFELNDRLEIYFCRCGLSGSKPFCNGMHAKCGFKASEGARVLPPA
jgi:CDGSH-type Zn-finger protein